MSEESELRKQTLALCHEINEKCQIDPSSFSYDILMSKEWYVEILEIVRPYLVDQLAAVRQEQDQGKAIDAILQLINSLDQFNEDVTESIKGQHVVSGDPVQIYYIVQVFLILLEQAIKNQQFSEDEQNQQMHQQTEQDAPERNPFSNYIANKNSATKSQQQEKSQKEGHHSVIGIRHEFEESNQSERESDFDIHNNEETYHPFQKQSNAKEQVQKTEKVQLQKQVSNFEPESSHSSEKYLLDQKLSETKMEKKPNKKPEYRQSNQKHFVQSKQKSKKLISHPRMPQKLKKAKSAEAIKLTEQIKKKIKSPKKTHITSSKVLSPTSTTIKKKKKQLDYYHNDFQTHKKVISQKKKQRKSSQVKTQANFNKLLNWRQEKLIKQQKQYEESLKMKLQNQKQLYVKKLNDVVIKMQKQKDLDDKKQFKEKLIQENNKAVRRLAALQQFYQDRLALIREDKHNNRIERNLISAGHKEIITQIEKQLKKENEDKILKMTEKYRKQTEFIQSDLEELQKKIIQAYKRN